ncbi:hypothetical protein [Methylomonas sp. MK1]|uniref:hypothetical protein n=1 Tax=Methylomonas sp. MK1 TaxID=1131552 RepID=UPI00035DB151|nr:hypothetical protein [Methylomonas sp. MK1]
MKRVPLIISPGFNYRCSGAGRSPVILLDYRLRGADGYSEFKSRATSKRRKTPDHLVLARWGAYYLAAIVIVMGL